MTTAGKIWGRTQFIWRGPNAELHRIDVKSNGYCSKHRHATKYNAFYVISGALEIKVWRKAYKLVDVTIVRPGQVTLVPPGEYHQFKALFETVALELYWTELRSDDIEWEGHGGSGDA